MTFVFSYELNVDEKTNLVPYKLQVWDQSLKCQRWTKQSKAINIFYRLHCLTHWVTHICVGNLTIIGSDNGLSPGRRQAIIWTSDGILLIGPLGIYSNEILFEIQIFSFKKMLFKMSSGKWRPFCLSLNVLTLKHDELCPDELEQHGFR